MFIKGKAKKSISQGTVHLKENSLQKGLTGVIKEEFASLESSGFNIKSSQTFLQCRGEAGDRNATSRQYHQASASVCPQLGVDAHEGLKEPRQGTYLSHAVLLALRNSSVKPQQPVPMQLAEHHLQTAIDCPSHQHPFPEGPSPYLEPSSYPQQAWGKRKSLVKTKNMPGPCG